MLADSDALLISAGSVVPSAQHVWMGIVKHIGTQPQAILLKQLDKKQMNVRKNLFLRRKLGIFYFFFFLNVKVTGIVSNIGNSGTLAFMYIRRSWPWIKGLKLWYFTGVLSTHWLSFKPIQSFFGFPGNRVVMKSEDTIKQTLVLVWTSDGEVLKKKPTRRQEELVEEPRCRDLLSCLRLNSSSYNKNTRASILYGYNAFAPWPGTRHDHDE